MPTPATVEASESNGAGETVTNGISNLNFGGVDVPNLVVATHPVIRTVAVAGTIFQSFYKCIRLHLVSLGDSLLIDNLRFWKTSGAYVDGETILVSTDAGQAYLTPVNTNLASAIAVGGLATSDDFSNTSTIGIGGSYAGQWNAAPAFSNYKILQWRGNQVLLTPIGAMNQKVLIFAYDES